MYNRCLHISDNLADALGLVGESCRCRIGACVVPIQPPCQISAENESKGHATRNDIVDDIVDVGF